MKEFASSMGSACLFLSIVPLILGIAAHPLAFLYLGIPASALLFMIGAALKAAGQPPRPQGEGVERSKIPIPGSFRRRGE